MKKLNGARIRKAGNGFIIEPEYDYVIAGGDDVGEKEKTLKPLVASSLKEAFKCAARFLGGGVKIEETDSPHADGPEELYEED